MLRVRRPSAAAIDRLLVEVRGAEPTYPEVGRTRAEQLPPGYRHDRYERRLGRGDGTFGRAAAALCAWQAQIGAGARVFPEGARVDTEDTIIMLIRPSGLWAALPCRVVYVDDEPERFAFAYGTLPGHPEQGEAAFRIERSETGDVFFRIVSVSRTVDPLARLGSPVTRLIQQRVTRRYLAAIAAASGATS